MNDNNDYKEITLYTSRIKIKINYQLLISKLLKKIFRYFFTFILYIRFVKILIK